MLTLTKESGQELVRNYFNGVLELKKRNEDFPVDIDGVWQLVYSERGKAVRALKANFIEGEDFRLFARNGKNINGRPKDDYRLSVSCLEYFVARQGSPSVRGVPPSFPQSGGTTTFVASATSSAYGLNKR